MATPNESLQPSPAHLKDADGSSILPLTPLPGVDFCAHLQQRSNSGAGGPSRANLDTESTSYFNAKPVEETLETRNEPDLAADIPASSAPNLNRVRTAPAAESSSRPRPLERRSTFRGPLRRARGSYSYTFDPMLSDSDSSSDDEGATAQTRRVAQGSVEANSKQDQRRRKHEKKGYSYSRFQIGNENFKSKGRVSKRDGRLNISINETAGTGYIAKAFGRRVKNHLDLPDGSKPRRQRQYNADHAQTQAEDGADANAEPPSASLQDSHTRPQLNVVIIVIGSRGDIQPFLRIGQILKREHGHRVRLATHTTFRDFVKEAGLEFFSVGGNPSELMAFMVKNPGLIPSLATLREGEIHRRRVAMGEMFEGMWRACTNIKAGETDEKNLEVMDTDHPFIADAIIANPPSMAPPHIVERLGIPLFMAFTFPYSPTQQFPHPLANIRSGRSNVDANYVNFMSYPLVEMMTWQGLGDIVNKFRVNSLRLEPVSSLWAPGALYRMKVPYAYMWSPSLISKPSDWGPEIDVTGFVFLDLASNFEPPKELSDFLAAGPPPVYIGFGSIVVDDPDSFTKMIFEAVKMAGVRAVVNKGWGGIGGDGADVPENVLMLGNTPHDWLFPRMKAVVHHGGAGTTAIGLKCAKPTMIVPFFGDQPFWGAEVAKHQAGALECVPYKKLTVERLAEGIKQCLTEEAQVNAQKLADSINAEGDGAINAVRSFHRSLPLAGRKNMRCSILEDRVAVWLLKGSSLRLSSLAAEILLEKGKIRRHDLKLLRHYSWNDFDGPGEPITGIAGALTDSVYGMGTGVGMVPVRIAKHIKKRQEHENKKQEILRRKEEHRKQKDAALAARNQAMSVDHEQGTTTLSDGTENGERSRPAMQREPTMSTIASKISADPSAPLALEVAGDIGRGIKKSGLALLTMPQDLHVAVAQGFHNAPRLWGDATVRKPTRITGFKSGCVAARRELTYGVYDGFTGVVTQPVGGWRDGDTIGAKLAGLGAGAAKGMGGFVLKNLSAVIAPPAYVGRGLLVFVEKRAEGEQSKKFIRRSQFMQGLIDVRQLRAEDEAASGAATEGPYRATLIEKRVTEGWEVYEDIWATAHRQYMPKGTLMGKIRFQRVRKRWAESGALENVDTANRALRVTKAGGNLDAHLEQRAQEMDAAEMPRAPGMERQPTPSGGKQGDHGGSSPSGARGAQQQEQHLAQSTDLAQINEEEDMSDTTVVGTPDNFDESTGTSAGHAKKMADASAHGGCRGHRNTVGAEDATRTQKGAAAAHNAHYHKPTLTRIATA